LLTATSPLGVVADDLSSRVEADLLADRSKLLGALDAWHGLRRRKQQRWITRLTRAERRRAAFEAAMSGDPEILACWQEFPPTEQREILLTLDWFRLWPLRWEIPKAIRAVGRGSDYRRRPLPR
jgi:hypothetical protein